MKKFTTFVFFALLSLIGFGQVGISATSTPPNAQAMLDVSSPTKGFLPPRMTFANRNAITTVGMEVYCTDCSPAGPYSFTGASWVPMFATATSSCPIDMVKTEVLVNNTLTTSTTTTTNNLYVYDGSGRVVSITSNSSTVVGSGTPTTSLVIYTYDYSTTGQVKEYANGVLNLIFILNAAGFATQVTNASTVVLQTYTYDALGYPLTGAYSGSSYTYVYAGANLTDDGQNSYNYTTYLNTVGNDNKGRMFMGKSSMNTLVGKHNTTGSIIKYFLYVNVHDATHGNRLSSYTYSTLGGSSPLSGSGTYTYY